MLTLAVFTEAQARDRVCPMRLMQSGRPVSACTCEASRCMAWRWAEISTAEEGDEGVGFCGLAGTPDAGKQP